ncbi:MAG TPA: archease [Dehalococcoidia bacterium]|nr:archease [Dehalococcoidia bacterium]
MGSFEVFEHTADAGVIAEGRTLPEVFVEAAKGMYSLMVSLPTVRPDLRREVDAEGNDLEHLLTNWLLELLMLTETEGLVFSEFHVSIADGKLHGVAGGESLDEARHDPQAVVKGVTRHLLSVEPADGGYRARVIFDL